MVGCFARALLIIAVTAGAAEAAPQPGAAAAAEGRRQEDWAAERQKLRLEIERVNGEIDTLKRAGGGVRDDYRLRRRMADAEALARRLTELDARLAAAGVSAAASDGRAPAPPSPAPLAAAPLAAPGDDPGVLEAKADILADQARRLTAEGDLLARRVATVRGRQELRRRAGQLDRDPFSPIENTRRRLLLDGGKTATTEGHTGNPGGSGLPTRGPSVGGAADPPGAVAGGPPPPSTGSDSGPAAPPGPLTTSGSAFTAPVGGSVAAQFSGILDAATLAEIRRLEAPGSASASLQAMERALAAVRARAAQLEAQARSLRQRAVSGR